MARAMLPIEIERITAQIISCSSNQVEAIEKEGDCHATAFIIVTNFVKHLPCYFEGLYVQFWLIYMEMGQSDNV